MLARMSEWLLAFGARGLAALHVSRRIIPRMADQFAAYNLYAIEIDTRTQADGVLHGCGGE